MVKATETGINVLIKLSGYKLIKSHLTSLRKRERQCYSSAVAGMASVTILKTHTKITKSILYLIMSMHARSHLDLIGTY